MLRCDFPQLFPSCRCQRGNTIPMGTNCGSVSLFDTILVPMTRIWESENCTQCSIIWDFNDANRQMMSEICIFIQILTFFISKSCFRLLLVLFRKFFLLEFPCLKLMNKILFSLETCYASALLKEQRTPICKCKKYLCLGIPILRRYLQ